MAKKTVFMPDHIQERCELAHTYACDGAYGTAAKILSELTKTVQAHADRNRRALDAAIEASRVKSDPINLAGSGPVPIEPREG